MSKLKITSMGIDPSLTGTGIVVVRDGEVLAQGLIKSKPSGDTPQSEIDRIKGIVHEVNEYLEKYKPDIVSMEGLAFMARNTSALMQLAGLNYLLRTMFHGYENWCIVAPSTLKKFITGKGQGDKSVIMMEIYKHYGLEIVDNNIADAFVLAQIGQAICGTHENVLTKTQQEVCSLLAIQLTT